MEIPDITGETFLSSLGFDTSKTTQDIGILVAMYGIFVILALVFFLMRLPRTSRMSMVPKLGSKAVAAAAP